MKTFTIFFRPDVYEYFDRFWREWSIAPVEMYGMYKDNHGERYLSAEIEVPDTYEVDDAIDNYLDSDIFDMVINEDGECILSDFGYVNELDTMNLSETIDCAYDIDANYRISNLETNGEKISLSTND